MIGDAALAGHDGRASYAPTLVKLERIPSALAARVRPGALLRTDSNGAGPDAYSWVTVAPLSARS